MYDPSDFRRGEDVPSKIVIRCCPYPYGRAFPVNLLPTG